MVRSLLVSWVSLACLLSAGSAMAQDSDSQCRIPMDRLLHVRPATTDDSWLDDRPGPGSAENSSRTYPMLRVDSYPIQTTRIGLDWGPREPDVISSHATMEDVALPKR